MFCARVADREQAIFRSVPAGPERAGGDGVISDTLTCLAQAQCDQDSVRAMREEAHRGAYDAWERARQDIFESWQHATDPANLQPRIPKPMRDAAELLRSNPPPELEQAELDRISDAIEAPYGARIQRMFRGAIASSENSIEQARAIVEMVKELGLEPAPAPEPLPVIELEDVHLVCWIAVSDR